MTDVGDLTVNCPWRLLRELIEQVEALAPGD